ncbi:extracellular thaumatin domain protein [Aspergillus terreus]|uniref:Extracellular thaumatin domain protein n=1 Tax=Aspergillus terreus TaxID=33178 RepID=A0A5M3YT82_ASPTE|nr:hypothetical protein ATETN484_0002047800 [Aspergillus terreus]GFF15334.1 extracellular thaumatin domain protein [Aspergillus terreus]
MMFTKAISAAAAFASLASALPHVTRRGDSGSVNIVNNLDHTVYAWSVSDRVSDMHTLSAGGGSYTEAWRTNDNGGGISIKLSTHPDQSDVLQFEYTIGDGESTIYWDMSCIDLAAQDSEFTKAGFSVTPSQTGANCPNVNCGAGDTACAEAYLQPKDDHATHGCPIDTTFTLSLGN